jgi:hypothetical protein
MSKVKAWHLLVRISRDDDGEQKPDWQDWHLVDPGNPGGEAALCTGEFFGVGESACEFETKFVRRGGITCQVCLDRLRSYKAVKL